jgi:hypothetical protein
MVSIACSDGTLARLDDVVGVRLWVYSDRDRERETQVGNVKLTPTSDGGFIMTAGRCISNLDGFSLLAFADGPYTYVEIHHVPSMARADAALHPSSSRHAVRRVRCKPDR